MKTKEPASSGMDKRSIRQGPCRNLPLESDAALGRPAAEDATGLTSCISTDSCWYHTCVLRINSALSEIKTTRVKTRTHRGAWVAG